MKIWMTSLMSLCLLSLAFAQERTLYKVTEGSISFNSEAPLESITATTKRIKGLIDPETRKFAFSIAMNGFEGFNNPLQKEHFYENFMEGSRFPLSTYSGRIIETVSFEEDQTTTIRTKGILNIHGVKRERIIKSEFKVEDGKLYVKSFFTILLKEHDIKIPKIVYQKIAKEIFVMVELVFEKN